MAPEKMAMKYGVYGKARIEGSSLFATFSGSTLNLAC